MGGPSSSDAVSRPEDAGTGDLGSARWIPVCVTVLALFLFVLRIAGPSNLTDNDQERPASYILDALRNGHWLVQYDWTGDITSKPPAYTWLAALASLPTGRLTLPTLYLPCVVSVLGAALLVAFTGQRAFGPRVGWLAALFFLANPLTAKLVALARTDPLFTFGVTLTACLAWRAWESGRGWIPVWLAASFATLTKGPLGILLGFGGLAAWAFERRSGGPSPWSSKHLAGAALLLIVTGTWFLLAWSSAGDALVRKMIGAELIGHAVGSDRRFPGIGWLTTAAYFLGRFAPWSLPALVGLWWAIRRPEATDRARRGQRFAAAWLVLGWFALGLGGHQRGDLIAPVLPAGALLAAIPVSHWLRRQSLPALLVGGTTLGMLFGSVFQWQHSHRPLKTFEETRGLEALARSLPAAGIDPRAVVHVDVPFALQFFLNTMNRTATPAEAIDRLGRGSAKWVAVADPTPVMAEAARVGLVLQTVAAWPSSAPNSTTPGTMTVPREEPPRFRVLGLEPVVR